MRAQQHKSGMAWRLTRWLPVFFGLPPAWSAELRFGLTEAQAAPLYIEQAGAAPTGLLPTLGAALAVDLQRTLRLERFPRKRYLPALLEGRLDLLCHAHPAWYEPDARLKWSAPYMQIWDVVVVRAKSAQVLTPPDLIGRRLGTVLGYEYPALTALFRQGVKRDDVEDESANWRRLTVGRLDLLVASSFGAAWRMRNWSEKDKPTIAPFRLDEISVRCLGTDAGLMQAVDASLARLKSSGELQRMLAPYQP